MVICQQLTQNVDTLHLLRLNIEFESSNDIALAIVVDTLDFKRRVGLGLLRYLVRAARGEGICTELGFDRQH